VSVRNKKKKITHDFSSARGQAVASLVQALRYKPESRGYKSRGGGFFQLT
jgi:hypothetical protein